MATVGPMLEALATATTCRITTVGRRTGEPHVVTVWFALDGSTLYAPSRHGLEGDWLRNVEATPAVEVGAGRGRATVAGRGRVAVAREDVDRGVAALVAKYRRSGTFVAGWVDDPPTMVAIELPS